MEKGLDLTSRMLDILYDYCRIPSFTNSAGEALVNGFLTRRLAKRPYFQAHPGHLGNWDIENDPHDRKVTWAFVRGGSDQTIVLLHHVDVVVTDNFPWIVSTLVPGEKIFISGGERVYLPDLLERIPQMIDHVIREHANHA